MANRQETIIIDVQVTDVKKQLGETAQAIFNLKEQNKQLNKERKDGTKTWEEATATIKANETQIKLLTAAEKSLAGQLNANEVANRSYGKSNTELRAQVVALENAYNGLTKAQKDTPEGRALLKQQNELKASVKANAEELGNFQDNVGNYFGKFGNFVGQTQSFISANGGLAGSFKAGGQAVLGFGKQLLSLLANPIVAIIAGIAGAVMLLVNAMKQNGAATEKFNQILAPFKLLLSTITAVLGKLVSTILDGVLAFGNFANSILAVIPGMDKMAERNKEAIRLEREKQSLIRQGIVDKAQDAKEELRLADLRKKINQADKYTVEQRLAFAREVDKAEKQMALDDANRANNNLKNFLKNMQLQGKAQKDYTIEELQQLTDLQAAKYSEQQAYYDKTRKTASREAALIAEIENEKNAKIEAAQEANEKRKKDAEEAEKKRIENIKIQSDNAKKAAEEDARIKKEAADKAIAQLDYELALFQAKQEEAAAKTNQTNKQIYDDKIALLNEQYLTEGLKLEEQLANNQITQDEYNKQAILLNQQKNAATAQENKAFEQAERDRKLAAAATDLQNEMAIAEMKGQSLLSLKLAQIETERLAEIEAAEKTGADIFLIEQKYVEMKKQLNRAEMSAKLDLASGFAGNIAEIFGKNTKVGKAAASAQIAIDTAKGAMAAFTSTASIPVVGPILGAAAAGAVVAKGVKSIKDVWAVKSGLPGDGGGGGATVPAAPTATTVPTPATKGADLVLNSGQAGSLNGKIAAGQPQSGGIDYDLLAKSMSKQPAPVMVYSEFKSFEGKITGFDEQTKI